MEVNQIYISNQIIDTQFIKHLILIHFKVSYQILHFELILVQPYTNFS